METRIFAVCIGIDYYLPTTTRDLGSLSGCIGDCDSWISYLTKVHHVPEAQITRLTSTRDGNKSRAVEDGTDRLATYDNIVRVLLKLSQECQQDDQVLVTYSGHGGRLRSLVSDWRGKDNGFDEVLVPMDYLWSKRALRDFELSYLLRKIVETKCRLTVVLDCCNSGGAFRAPDDMQEKAFETAGLRARFVTLTMQDELTSGQKTSLEQQKKKYIDDRPLGRVTTGGKEVPGVSIEELQKYWDEMQDRTGTVPKDHWLVKPFGYEVWTGCLAHELSWEVAGNGRLTVSLVDTLRFARNQVSLGMIYRNVYDQVYGKRGKWYWKGSQQYWEPMLQTPLMLGNGDRGFLTDNTSTPQVIGIPISAVPYDNSNTQFTPFDAARLEEGRQFPTLILRAGSAHGVQLGSEYAVYLWDDNLNIPPLEGQVRVVITQVGTVASVIRIVGSPDLSLLEQISKEQHIRQSNRMKAFYDNRDPDKDKKPQDITYPWPSGCQAVLVTEPSANAKRIRLVAEGDSTVPSPWDGPRKSYVRTEVPLLVVSEDSTPTGEDFQVRYSNGQYAVHDGGSSGVLLTQTNSVETALRNIVQISQYRSWLKIVKTTTHPRSTRFFKLEQIGRVPVEGKPNIEKITLGFNVGLDYINTYSKTHVKLALFHFSPTFGVRQIFPREGQFESIDAGDSRMVSFERDILQTDGPGVDVIKAVVYQASTGFKIWELPELGKEGGEGQPVRQWGELQVRDPAPGNLAELDPVPGESGDDTAALRDGEREGYEKYWLLQIQIKA